MIIASGNSDRHVRAIAERVIERAKQAGRRPMGTEGRSDAEWVLVDLQDVLVHVMLPRVREFYALEQLWEAPVVSRTEEEGAARSKAKAKSKAKSRAKSPGTAKAKAKGKTSAGQGARRATGAKSSRSSGAAKGVSRASPRGAGPGKAAGTGRTGATARRRPASQD
jgi:hypothetical protein